MSWKSVRPAAKFYWQWFRWVFRGHWDTVEWLGVLLGIIAHIAGLPLSNDQLANLVVFAAAGVLGARALWAPWALYKAAVGGDEPRLEVGRFMITPGVENPAAVLWFRLTVPEGYHHPVSLQRLTVTLTLGDGSVYQADPLGQSPTYELGGYFGKDLVTYHFRDDERIMRRARRVPPGDSVTGVFPVTIRTPTDVIKRKLEDPNLMANAFWTVQAADASGRDYRFSVSVADLGRGDPRKIGTRGWQNPYIDSRSSAWGRAVEQVVAEMRERGATFDRYTWGDRNPEGVNVGLVKNGYLIGRNITVAYADPLRRDDAWLLAKAREALASIEEEFAERDAGRPTSAEE